MIRTTLLLFALAIAGCSSVTDVMPTGIDTYMVGSNAHGGFSNDAEVKSFATRRANEFCAGQSKRAQVTASQSTGTQMWTPQNAEEQFACVGR